MSKQTEALKLALRSIRELVINESDDAPALQGVRMRKLAAEKAIREALAEQPAKEKAPQSANCEAPGWISSDHARGDDCTTEQPSTVTDNSQEWRGMDGATAYWLIQRHADGWADIGKMMDEWRVANQPAQQQEPVAWLCMTDQYSKIVRFEWETFGNVTPLYKSPPASKPWVGLTDEEIDKTYETQVWDARRSYARAIEAKLREKNA